MKINIYQVDAFANTLFTGNPAAVCLLETWLADDILQKIASENNLSATAFLVPRDNNYHIRWFTPYNEVDLCGHATLASAYIVFNHLQKDRDQMIFYSASGDLMVTLIEKDVMELDFPVLKLTACEVPELLHKALNIPIEAVYRSKDYLVITKSENEVRNLKPNMQLLQQLDLRGLIVSAPGLHYDFVSRFFTPQKGVPEDPVTGSAHCTLTPYWSERLAKSKLHAKQLSQRSGEILCELRGDRVVLKGKVVSYLEGVITI